jgi:hypothetical protein
VTLVLNALTYKCPPFRSTPPPHGCQLALITAPKDADGIGSHALIHPEPLFSSKQPADVPMPEGDIDTRIRAAYNERNMFIKERARLWRQQYIDAMLRVASSAPTSHFTLVHTAPSMNGPEAANDPAITDGILVWWSGRSV